MEPMTASELAQRAAVPGAFVDRLVELGNLLKGIPQPVRAYAAAAADDPTA
jgi:hypothetical protein